MTREKTSLLPTMTRRDLLGRGACTMATLSAAPWLMDCGTVPEAGDRESRVGAGAEGKSQSAWATGRLPRRVAGIRIPDSNLAQAAAELALSVSPDNLYNHCIRTYLFAALVYKGTGVKFDEELTFVAAALHDLGLVEQFMTPNERFEVDGADAALRFLRQWRVPAARAGVVWDAIALHTSVGIVTRKAPEIAAVSIGAGIDATGNGLQNLSTEDVAEVLTAYPRLDFKKSAVASIIAYCEKKPTTLLLHPWESVGRRHIPNFPLPPLEDIILGAPFAE
jgi:hypothetical protein